MLPPVFVELLLGLAGEGAFRTRVGPLSAMIHLLDIGKKSVHQLDKQPLAEYLAEWSESL